METLNALNRKLWSEADVKWCEPNHELSVWVAEPFNTASSLALILLGLHGYTQLENNPLPSVLSAVHWRFHNMFKLLIYSGIGSVVHHGSMFWIGQVLDELPSLWGTMLLLFSLVATSQRKADNISTMLVMHTMMATGAYMFWGFQYYAGAQGLSCLAVVLMCAHVSLGNIRGLSADDQCCMRGLATKGLLAFGVGFFCVWVPEHWLCDSYPHQMQPLRLHAIFHLLCAYGSYTMIAFVQYYSYERSQLQPRVQYDWAFVPTIIPKVRHFKK